MLRTGRFLLGALRELRNQLEAIDPSDPRRIAGSGRLRDLRQNGLLGADQSTSSVAKARVNLLLHGIAHPFRLYRRGLDHGRVVDQHRLAKLRLILRTHRSGTASTTVLRGSHGQPASYLAAPVADASIRL